MDRLTKYSNETSHKNGVCCTHFLSDECRALGGECAHGCKWEEAAWERLAAFEDFADECGGLDRLRELAEADKEGRVVVLPCKVGDVVYGFHGEKTILSMEVKWIETCTNGWCIAVQYAPMAPRFYRFSDFGKTVFLTHEEAKKALEAKRDGSTSM